MVEVTDDILNKEIEEAKKTVEVLYCSYAEFIEYIKELPSPCREEFAFKDKDRKTSNQFVISDHYVGMSHFDTVSPYDSFIWIRKKSDDKRINNNTIIETLFHELGHQRDHQLYFSKKEDLCFNSLFWGNLFKYRFWKIGMAWHYSVISEVIAYHYSLKMMEIRGYKEAIISFMISVCKKSSKDKNKYPYYDAGKFFMKTKLWERCWEKYKKEIESELEK